jgi:hypothetical protein
MKVYWKTKDGRVMDVDDMSDTHVRNAFKMLLRKLADAKAEQPKSKPYQVKLNGDAANDFNESMEYSDLCDATGLDLY